jgi:hypothetical protein
VAMIAMTTRSSINVNPLVEVLLFLDSFMMVF